jgi:hypothetical protein
MRRAVLSATLVLASIAGACSAFSDAEDTPAGSADASVQESGSDGALRPDAFGSPDASADGDATAACTASTAILADDFMTIDEVTWNNTGSKCDDAGAGLVPRDAGTAVVLSCESTTFYAYRVLQSRDSYPINRRMELSFSFRLGAGNYGFAQLVSIFGETGDNMVLLVQPSTIEARRAADSALLAVWTRPMDGEFHTFTIGIDAPGGANATLSAKAAVDGAEKTFAMERNVDGGRDTFEVQLGVFLNLELGAFQNAYDDLRFWSCP